MKTTFLTIAALLVSGSVMALDATTANVLKTGGDVFVVAGKSVGNTGVGPALRQAGLSGVQVTGVLSAIKAIELKKGSALTQADYASLATAANGKGLSVDATLKQLSATANGNTDAAFNVVFASSAQTTTASNLPKAPQASNVNTDPVVYVAALANDLSVDLEDRAALKLLSHQASTLKDAKALKQVAAIAKLAPLAFDTSAAHCGDLDSKTCEAGRVNQLVRFGLTDFALTVGGIGFEEETLKGFLGQEGADAYATPVYVGSSFGLLGEVRAGRQISSQLFACLNGTNMQGSASGLVSK